MKASSLSEKTRRNTAGKSHAVPHTEPANSSAACTGEVQTGMDCLCRFVMGSNKVLRVALGHGEEDEYKKGLSALAEDISGSIGLFFTRLPEDQVFILLCSCILLLRLECCERSNKQIPPLAASWDRSAARWSFLTLVLCTSSSWLPC